MTHVLDIAPVGNATIQTNIQFEVKSILNICKKWNMIFLELKNINKNNLDKVATYFSKNHSIKEIMSVSNIIDDNGYGTLFLESKLDEMIKFSIQIDNNNPFSFSSILFGGTNIILKELIELYALSQKTYIPYDNEYCYSFMTLNGSYRIEAYIDGSSSEDVSQQEKLHRLIIRW